MVDRWLRVQQNCFGWKTDEIDHNSLGHCQHPIFIMFSLGSLLMISLSFSILFHFSSQQTCGFIFLRANLLIIPDVPGSLLQFSDHYLVRLSLLALQSHWNIAYRFMTYNNYAKLCDMATLCKIMWYGGNYTKLCDMARTTLNCVIWGNYTKLGNMGELHKLCVMGGATQNCVIWGEPEDLVYLCWIHNPILWFQFRRYPFQLVISLNSRHIFLFSYYFVTLWIITLRLAEVDLDEKSAPCWLVQN